MGQVRLLTIATATGRLEGIHVPSRTAKLSTSVAAQTMSFGLTQYDMEELMTFTNNQCASNWSVYPGTPAVGLPCVT